MNLLKKIKQLVYNACLYFTAAEFAILITAELFAKNSPQDGGEIGKFLSLSASGLILLGAFIMSALNFIWKLKLSSAVKLILHFIGSFAAFTLLFIFIPAVYANMAQVIVRSAIFAAIYFIIAFIVLIVKSISQNRRADKLEYENKFEKN